MVWASFLVHHGIEGMHWGERRYQNEDGTLTPLGKLHYGSGRRMRGLRLSHMIEGMGAQNKNGAKWSLIEQLILCED